MADFYTDREYGPRVREIMTLESSVIRAIESEVDRLLSHGAFGRHFPTRCPDNPAVIGNNSDQFWRTAEGMIPGLVWPSDEFHVASAEQVFDLLEFCFNHVAYPESGQWHQYFQHHHLSFDVGRGQAKLRSFINDLFERNGVGYELDVSGKVVRLGAPVVGDLALSTRFNSGDEELDTYLKNAVRKFRAHSAGSTLDAVKELWDAFERYKTILGEGDKKTTADDLLARMADDGEFLDRLRTEAKELTEIGNRFMIRHSERHKTVIKDDAHAEYLFHRMFSFLWLAIRKTGTGGKASG